MNNECFREWIGVEIRNPNVEIRKAPESDGLSCQIGRVRVLRFAFPIRGQWLSVGFRIQSSIKKRFPWSSRKHSLLITHYSLKGPSVSKQPLYSLGYFVTIGQHRSFQPNIQWNGGKVQCTEHIHGCIQPFKTILRYAAGQCLGKRVRLLLFCEN